MNCNKTLWRMVLSIFWILLGAVLFTLGVLSVVDEFFSGFGGALLAVGILQLIRHIRYRTNDSYKEKVDVEVNDERNKFLSNKSWAWTGYISVLGLAVGAVVFRIMGKDELCSMCATVIALMAVIHLIVYAILKRKY